MSLKDQKFKIFKKQCMKLISLVLVITVALVSCDSVKNNLKNQEKINATINSWHEYASKANYDEYFKLMSANGVFIGTDATENWQIEAFKTFSKPYFDKGKAWSFNPLNRNVYLSKNQKIAWFDELLDTQMKICRGSGVVIKIKGEWRIAHYVLSMTVPNDKTTEVVNLKSQIESEEIIKLKNIKP